MSPEISKLLDDLQRDINTRLDLLHDGLLAKLRFMARSFGQQTRVDRVKK